MTQTYRQTKAWLKDATSIRGGLMILRAPGWTKAEFIEFATYCGYHVKHLRTKEQIMNELVKRMVTNRLNDLALRKH